MTELSGRYLFAVTRGLDAGDLVATEGLRGDPLAIVEHRGLQAVVCDVPLEEFGEDALVRNLEDLGWVEQVARTHDTVVREVAHRATVAPMRLVTIYSSDDSVRSQLDELQGQLTDALDRVAGCAEWAVKIYAHSVTAPEAAPQKPASGADYLKRKRDLSDARRNADADASQVAEQLDSELALVATARRRLAIQDPRLSGRQESMILNAAYLVPDDASETFAATVESLSATYPDVTIEAAGPWPPYSFSMLE